MGIAVRFSLDLSAIVLYQPLNVYGLKCGRQESRGRAVGMRAIHRLSAVKVATLKRAGYYADGGCLYLKVTPTGSKSWIFRFALEGRKRDAGLGVFPAVSLVKARGLAQRYRELVADGTDPIEARKGEREKARLASAKSMTFEQCAKAYINSHEAGWRSSVHRKQWRRTLAAYVFPVIGTLPVRAIETTLVLKALEPIWREKTDTAARIRGRIEAVLDWAKVRGYRDGENPARWRGHLDHLLPAKSKLVKVKHHAALPYREINSLMARLRCETATSARALELMVLTATRLSEALGARWEENDFNERMWTIRGERMKSGREHRVPLSARSVAILNEMAKVRHNEFVFPGAKQGRPLSRVTLLAQLRKVGSDHTAHGFRSTFRDWAAEQTRYPREAAELALAHSVGGAVERAYQRGDLIEKRRKLMEAWADYCDGSSISVIHFRTAAA